MTDDEAKRINDFIAERVMEYAIIKTIPFDGHVTIQDNDGNVIEDYDPYHNIAQAIEAAEKWCDEHKPMKWKVERVWMDECVRYNGTIVLDAFCNEVWRQAKSHAAALCLALVAAVEAE